MGLTGSLISHYEILRQLGKGGMGEVWLAHDTVLDRQVAIKFLPENIQADPVTRERFLREAKAAAALDHPFICKIYETGESDGRNFIVMEFVEGQNLGDAMAAGPIPAPQALKIVCEVAEALDVAHAKGIVHRDLKPANIMCTPQGHAKVMDFGIAKRIQTGSISAQVTMTQTSMTAQGMIVGTIDYMSPEQAKGAPVDGRSDVFSLGVILYELLAGKNPFSKPTLVETLSSVIKDPPPAFVIKPKVAGPELQNILKKCLAKNPADRYAKISDLAAELQKVRDEVVGGGRLFPRRWQAIAAAALVLVVAGLVVWRTVLTPKAPVAKTEVEPVSVLLADVQNKTGETIFDGVLEKVLSISLDSAAYISLYDSKQARQRALEFKPGGAGRLDMETAQLLARSAGINVIISGSIENASPGYLVKMWALDPAKGTELQKTEQNFKDKTGIFKVAEVLTSKLQAQLVKIPSDSKQAFVQETYTTTSLEAMKSYANAQELDAQGKPAEAIKEYERTLDFDPNFGRAYSGLGALFYSRGDQQKAEEFYKKALQHIDRMTDREKWRTRGGYYLCTFNPASAAEQYSALVKRYPNDSAGHSMLAFAYFLNRTMDKAYEEGDNALKLNPHHIATRYNFCWFALAAGQFERTAQEAKTLIEANPDFEESYILAALAELTQGRTARAVEFYQRLEALGPPGKTLAATGLADIALYEGRIGEAVKILEAGIPFDVQKDWKDIAALKAVMLGQTYADLGRKEQAAKNADRALQLSSKGNILLCAGEIYLRAGKDDKAREIQGRLGKLIEPENQAYLKLLGGAISLARGDAVNASNLFKESQKQADSWLARLCLGKAYLQANAFAEAQAEFENCLKRRGEATSVFFNDLPSYHYFPQVYYYLGLAQQGIGGGGAKASYETFLTIKAKADPGETMVADAKKRAGQL